MYELGVRRFESHIIWRCSLFVIVAYCKARSTKCLLFPYHTHISHNHLCPRVSAVADELCCTVSQPTCCKQSWTLTV